MTTTTGTAQCGDLTVNLAGIWMLQAMCDKGEAETLAAAAAVLDWQDHIILNDEHMYGF